MLPLQGVSVSREEQPVFQWAPTLGGECYASANDVVRQIAAGFNGHPPLGVNATQACPDGVCVTGQVSMGTHPWG